MVKKSDLLTVALALFFLSKKAALQQQESFVGDQPSTETKEEDVDEVSSDKGSINVSSLDPENRFDEESE